MWKIFLAMVFLMGTASAAEWQPTGSGDLMGERFILTAINGKAAPGQREIFIEMGEHLKLSGRVCNAFSAQSEIRDGVLKVPEGIASTRMLCPDKELQKLENDFFRYLKDGMSIFRSGDMIEMRRDDLVLDFRIATSEKAVQPTEAKKEGVSIAALNGRKFTLAKLDGKEFAVKMGRQPFIEFSVENGNLRVIGSACNNFMGPGELVNGRLQMKNAASTMMMCMDPDLSAFERDFHTLLREGVEISLDGATLVLEGSGRTVEYAEEK